MTEPALPLLTISAFARAVDLAPSALRYYDEAGLLPPAEVDPQTGYRYYTPALQRQAQMIRRMREIGVPVETMRLVLNGPPARAAELLRGFAAQAADSARLAAAAVADVVASLRAADAASEPVVVPVDGPELAVALSRVSRAAGATPEQLNVVILDVADSALTVVATDRYWLASWSLPLPGVHVGERRIAVPLAAVEELVAWLSRQTTVTMSTAPEQTLLRGDVGDFTVPTTQDRFPAYRLIIEDQPATRGRATVDRDALLAALDTLQVRVVAGRDRLTVSPPDGYEGVHLAAVTGGETVTMGFSAPLLRTAVTAMVGTTVTLSYTAADRPVRVTSAYQRNFAALVMPYRLER